MSSFNTVKNFRFWCQKVLPLVYDNSLSYYEVLCKLVKYLNEVIDNINNLPDYVDEVINERLSDEELAQLIETYVAKIEASISANNEEDNTNSSTDYSIGEMLWWNGELYHVIVNIDAGDTLISGTNIEKISFEELFNDFVSNIKNAVTTNDDGANATASQNLSTGSLIWLNDTLYSVISDITEGNAYVFTGDNANVESTTIEDLIKNIYYPNQELLKINAIIDGEAEITVGDVHTYSEGTSTITITEG